MGYYTWLLLHCDSWWAYSLWLLLLSVSLGYIAVRRSRRHWRLLCPVGASVFLTVMVVCGVLALCLPFRLMLPVAAVLAAGLFETLSEALCAYIRSYDNTQAHRYYLLANGATLLESLFPSVRRALRAAVVPQLKRLSQPLVAVGSMLFWGMLMGGLPVEDALVSTLLLGIAAFVATVMATLTTILFLTFSQK